MAVSWKVTAVSAAVVLAAALAWRVTRPSDEPHGPEAKPAAPATARVAPPGPAAPPGLATAPGGGTASPPPGPAAPTEPAPPAETPRIRGRVVDAKGAPMGAATVWLDTELPGEGAVATTSGADGGFEIAAAEGSHVVRARAQHTATARGDVTVPPGSPQASVPDLVLVPGGTIRGRVVDGAGKPLGSVRVKAMAQDAAARVREVADGGRRLLFGMDDVVTADDGTFGLSGLEPVPHRVWLELYMTPQFRAEPPERTGVMPEGEPVEFRLLPKNVLRGVVIDARTKRPIPRFTVDGRDTRSPEGRFEMPAGVGGDVEVTARGYFPEKRENPASREGDTPRDSVFSLSPDPDCGSLLVTVRDEEGNPVPDFRLQAVGPAFAMWDEEAKGSTASTGRAGELRVTGLPAGAHKGTVQADGYSVGELSVTVPKADEVRLEVRLARAVVVRLRILDEKGNVARYAGVSIADAKGAGPAWRWVFARPQGTAFVMREMTVFAATPPGETSLSEAEGRIEGLAVGKYVLRVTSGDVVKEVPFELRADQEGAVEVRLGP